MLLNVLGLHLPNKIYLLFVQAKTHLIKYSHFRLFKQKSIGY